MRTSHPLRPLFVALCALAVLLLAYPLGSAASTSPPLGKDPVNAAWRRAQDAGVYRSATTIVVTTHPAPYLANVGRGSRQERTYIEGETNLPESTLHLTLWANGGSVFPARDGLELQIDGGRALVRETGGHWHETDADATVVAPGNDLMGYLVGARNLREVGTERRSVPGSSGDQRAIEVLRYAFDFNGPRVAAYMADQLEDHLRQKGELPAGLHLDTSEQFRNAIGEGEVWVDGDGLPLRLSVHIEYPQERNGERVEVDIQTDFSGFDRQRLAAAQRPLARVSGALGLPRTAKDARRLRQQVGLALGTLSMLGLVVMLRRSKVFYAVFVVVIIGSMVVTPVLQSQQVHAFAQRLAADRAEQQRLEEQREAEEALGLLYGSDWDPHQHPQAVENPRESARSLISNPGVGSALAVAAPLPKAQASVETTEDDDGDGVPDDEDPRKDSDGDGLTDLQEKRLGTDPESADSDLDQIPDRVEVEGFYYNGRRWYLDPNNPDTNDDGLTDTVECPQLIVDSPTPGEYCQDTDNDGTPDVFDHDNDGDGVPDRMDLSPFSYMDNNGSPFTEENPLALIVSDLQPGKPAFVDFQLRPENEDHLWYALNVFDWPSGDEEGQIHRKRGNHSTFADVAEPGESVAPNASNGDIRLIPMMEIEMTGNTVPLKLTDPEISAEVEGELTGAVKLVQDGDDIQLDFSFGEEGPYEVKIQDGSCLDPGNTVYTFTNVISGSNTTINDRSLIDLANGERIFTVSDGTHTECSNLGNIINGPYHDRMIDPAPLQPYGITVREKNEDGVLLAYVPLGLVHDATGGDRVAFSARMHYWPETDDWGDAQTVRVVWLVQMLVDQCTQRPCSDDTNWLLDQTRVVYTYPEEWYLTGLSVREDHGLQVAIAYEDPSEEPSDEDRMYDDFLWKLADGLGATFMTGRDDDGDGLRDITISEIAARFDVTSTATITQRWGIPPTVTMGVETFAYDHEDFAAHIMMTETRKILDGIFTGYVDQGSDAPSLLFARETHYLSVNLDENAAAATQSDLPDGNGKLLTMSIGAAKMETGVYMNWAPYRYRNGAWESYPIDEYWDKMEVRFKGIFHDSDEETQRGELKMAQSFYAALFVGQAALVQVGVDITGNYEAQQSDSELTSGIEVGFSGGGIARLTKAYAGTWKKLFGIPFTLREARQALTEKKEMRFRRDAYTAGAQAIATFLMIGLYEVAAHTGQDWLSHTLNGIGAVWATYDAVVLSYTMYSAYRGSADALAKLSQGPTKLGTTLLGIGFLISQITMWGIFFSDMHNSGAKPGSLAYNYAASMMIAATITAIVWLGFSLLPGIGQIMTFLGLFESMLGFICGLTNSDNPICMRLTGFLTMGFQWWLYSSNLMLDLKDRDRLQFGSFDQTFEDPARAMAVGNSLAVRGTVTNTIGFIDKMDIRGWHGLAYTWQYSTDNLRSSTFKYELSPSGSRDIHDDLDRGDMRREWDCSDKDFDARCTIDEALDTQSPVSQAGINRPTALYLSEGYAVPVQECWGIGVAPFIIPVCYVRTEKGTNPMNLSGMLRYDAFPATLDEFVALDWSRGTYPTFARQADHDGDGLLSRSYPHRGPDPNDRDWDSDNDGLSDFFELQWGSNPQDFDSDNDGLSDRQEALLGTDPYRADTDGDGLLDSEEVFHQNLSTGEWSGGWEFVYGFAEDGSPLTTWVTSDPLTIDGDNDGWTDFQEKTYGFNPRVPSQKAILTLESNVREEDAPLLLLRLNETDGATTFRDDSGYGNSAACQGDNCPAAGHRGRYGNAAHFDGDDDYLEIEVDVSETAYTLALWFKTSCADCGIFSADHGKLGSGGHDRHLYLSSTGNLCARVWNNETICTAGTNYADGGWHHAAHVFGGPVGGQKLYVDGVQRASGSKSSSDLTAQTGINIGTSNDATNRYFRGLLDEVILFEAALSQEEIEVLMAGRYNSADLMVKPGDTLYYKATVANELDGRYAQGLLSTDFPGAVSGEIPPKAFVLHPQEEETLEGAVTVSDGATSGAYRLTHETAAMITDWREASDYAEMLLQFSEEVTTTTTFHDSSGHEPPRDGSCQSPHCPSSVGGPFGNALEFDGTNDYVDASKVVGHVSGLSFSYGGWVYPSSEQVGLGAVFVFNAEGEDRTAVYYDRSESKFMHCTETTGNWPCFHGSHTFEPDQWHHLMVTVDPDRRGHLYVNGVEDLSFTPDSVAGNDRFEIGRKWYSPGVGQHFGGRIDEVVVFNKALSPQQVQEQFGKPAFDMPLDESPGATVFEDESAFDNDATCASGNCPEAGVDGMSGFAARFDGDDFLSVPESSALDLDDGLFTLSAWVAPEDQAPASSCPWRAEYYEYWYNVDDSRYVTDPFENRTPVLVRCEDEIDQNWGTGGPAGMRDNFGVRWIGRFEMKRGYHDFHVLSDDGYQLYVGGTSLSKRWWEGGHDQTIRHWVGGGPTTIKLDYFERWGSAKAKLDFSPDPDSDRQGILGADDYPVVQRVKGDRLRIVLNHADGEASYTTDGDVLTPGEWSHVVVTYDGNTLALYVDGSHVGEVATSERSSGRAFDIGRGTGTRQLQLDELIVQDGGDTNWGGDSDLELYLQLKEGDGDWETLWFNDTTWLGSYDLDIDRTIHADAILKMYESDEGEYTECTLPNYCGGEDPADEQMGSHPIGLTEPSRHQAAHRFESDRDDIADLLYYDRTDSVPFRGRIDEVALYKRAFDADEVTALYRAQSLALHLALDDPPGSTTFQDAAGNSNGSCTGHHCPIAGVPGRDNVALLFDGDDDYVEVEVDVSESVYALALWFKTSRADCGVFSVDDGSLGSGGHDRDIYLDDGNLCAQVANDETICTSAADYADGNWHHVVHTFGGDVGGQKLYVDGVQRAAGDRASSEFDGQTGVNIGFSNDAGHPYFEGRLDDVRLYKRALSSEEIQSLYQAAPQMLLLLDEDVGATVFEDAAGNGHDGACSGNRCPVAGAKGQLGLAVQMDGDDDYIEVPHSPGLVPDQELTLAAWVNMTASDVDQIIVGKSTGSDGYALAAKDGELYPRIWDSTGTLRSGQWGSITPGYWTHVAVTWETGGAMVGYVNGNEVGRVSASSQPIGSNTGPLRLGIAPWDTSQFPANGLVDHVTLYRRALLPGEMRQLYRFQAKWVEERQSTEITIDADAPRSVLASDETYRPNRDAVQLVTAEDATSYVTMVEMGVSTDDGLSYTWETAPACQDRPTEGAAWCPTFDPTEGEGRYVVQTRATDVLGNVEVPTHTNELLVDDTPPEVGTAMQEGEIVRLVPHPEDEKAWLAPLHGTATDPALVSGDPGSGVSSVTVRMFGADKLTDTLPMPAALNGDGWEADFAIRILDPTGTYTVEAQATDNVGNATDIIPLVNIAIDASPPEANLDPVPSAYTDTITSTLTFSGLVTETGVISTGIARAQIGFLPGAQAASPHMVTQLHLNELPGAALFHNGADPANPATCQGGSCPASGVEGVWGRGVSFEDWNDILVVNDVGQRLTSGALSFGAWVYPEKNGTLLLFNEQLDEYDTGVWLGVGYSSGGSRFTYYDTEVSVQGKQIVGFGRWYHVMAVIDEAGNGTLYVDGKVEATFETTVRPESTDHLFVGDGLEGHVDEVVVYDGPFTAAEVYASYVDTTLANSGEGVLDTTWTYTGPEELDGLYQINLYAEDVISNGSRPPDWDTGWRGTIDTRAPRVAVTVEELGISDEGIPSFHTRTTYRCWAQDFNLYVRTSEDDDTPTAYDFQCPCQRIAPHATVYTATYYHEVSPWYAEAFTDTTRLYEYEASCTVPGLAVASTDMRACDIYGRCTEAIAEPTRYQIIAPIDSAVLTPTHNTILTSTAPMTITGHAYARDRLKRVDVKVDNVVVDTHTWEFTPAVTNTIWSTRWTPTEGAHTLRSVANDHNGQEQLGELVRPVDVFVDSSAPQVDISPKVLTTTHRLGRGRVALTGQASDATSGIDHIEVQIDGGGWQRASAYDDRWRYEWYLGEDVAGETYTVTARATDMAGHTSRVTETVHVDLEVPNPITLTLTSGGQDVPRGTTIRTASTILNLSWVTSTARSDLEYDVIWSVYNPDRTDHHVSPSSIPHDAFESQYTSGDGQRIVPTVISRLSDGNRQRDVYGSVYVDSPLTPNYVSLHPADGERYPYRGWMESGCSLVGTDRRVAGRAQDGASLAQAQNLYVSWDAEGLRIAWTGANWDYDGDLFIYLNTWGEGAAAAYNPYTQTQGIEVDLSPLIDDAMGGFNYGIWVEDARTATFMSWDTLYWELTTPLLKRENYQFHRGLDGGTTDLYIPFEWIGVHNPELSPLVLVVFATEDLRASTGPAMRLWSTMPPVNPVNSGLVVDKGIFAGDAYSFNLPAAYAWPRLGSGVCPNRPGGLEGLDVGADLRFDLHADPVGSTYGLMSDGLFWLQDALTDPDRPADLSESFAFIDTDHPPVGDGDTITYTLRYENRGTVSTTVTATVSALFGLRLLGDDPTSQTLSLGEIEPGESGSITFQGAISLTATYSTCVSLNPTDVDFCEPLRNWALARIVVSGDAYGPATPLDWLSADHRIDSERPAFLGIQEPERFIGVGDTLFRGYAYDDSGVPLVRIGTDPYTVTDCVDPTPFDGQWSCGWNATAANGGTLPSDGQTFNLRLQAVDGLLQPSNWTAWQTFVVDAAPPTVTFSAQTTAAYSGTVVNDTPLTFRGLISDTGAVQGVQVCLDAEGSEEACGDATLQAVAASSSSYADVATEPQAISSCDVGGIEVTFAVADAFEVGAVQLGINIDHERRSELSGALTSPTGTKVPVLGASAGTPPVYQNLDVLLYDAATSALHDFKGDDDASEPLYDREARPLEPMSVFRGEETFGTWTLTLCDTVPVTNTGTYNQARLVLTPEDTSAKSSSWSYSIADMGAMDHVKHTVTAVGTDAAGNQSEPISLQFTVDNVGPSIEVTESVAVTITTPNRPPVRLLGGTAQDGGRIVQIVAFVSAPDGTLSNRQVGRSEEGDGWWFELTPQQTGHYNIWVSAVDGAENSSRVGAYDVEISQAPMANAGEDQIVGPGELVTLDGSGSQDFSGDPLTYGWSQIGGPAVTLSDSTAVTPTFHAPTHSSPITFTLTVTSSSALTDTDSTVVTVASVDLTLEKSASADTPREGEKMVYVITATNNGPDQVTGLVVSDTLPGGVTFDAHDGGYDADRGEWTVPTLTAGVSDTLRITVTVAPDTWGTLITNTAVITQYSPGDLTTDDHWAQAVIAAQHADAVIVTVTPEAGGTLVYVNEQGYTTTVEIPAGAVSERITIVLTPLDGPSRPTAPWGFAGHAFTLEAYHGPYLLPGYVFQEPIAVTVHYSDADVTGIDEATLALYRWAGGGWQDATCGRYEPAPEENWLSVEICHLSEFALLGQGESIPVGGETLIARPTAGLGLPAALAVAVMALVLAFAAAAVRRRE